MVVKAAVEGVVLGAGDFGEGAAEVDGGGAGAGGGAPGDGLAEGEVDLEDAGAALKGAEALEIAEGEGGVGDAHERGDAGVEECCAAEGAVGRSARLLDVGVEEDAAAKGVEVAGEGVGEGLRAAGGDGPAGGVAGGGEDDVRWRSWRRG